MLTNNVPTTLLEAVRYYSDMENCIELLVRLRWADGITCPQCDSKRVGRIKLQPKWQCKDCRKQFTAKVGTVMEDSPIGLDKWLLAMWMIGNCKNGVSSYEVSRAIGVTQKSAWFMLHRIRFSMNNQPDQLSGHIEADETFIGGLEKNKHKKARLHRGRGGTGKAVVAGVLERGGAVKMKVVPTTASAELATNVRASVAKGSRIYTDAHRAYTELKADYVHAAVDHAVEYVKGAVHTNGLENFWSLLKRTLRGTYVSCDVAHLGSYVDEQAFRYNLRKSNDAGRFMTIAASANGKRLTWKKLVGRQPAR